MDLDAPRRKWSIFLGFHEKLLLVWKDTYVSSVRGRNIPVVTSRYISSKLYIMVCFPRDRVTVQPVPGSSYGRGRRRR